MIGKLCNASAAIRHLFMIIEFRLFIWVEIKLSKILLCLFGSFVLSGERYQNQKVDIFGDLLPSRKAGFKICYGSETTCHNPLYDIVAGRFYPVSVWQ